jgi:pyruvate carboxylase
MAGLTSQPDMGAIVNDLHGTPLDTGVSLQEMQVSASFFPPQFPY